MQTIHLTIAILTGLVVLYADEQAALWVLGKKQLFNPATNWFLHRAISIGLMLLIITGGIIYVQAAPAYLSLRIFDIKMVTVFALILNTYAIHRFSKVALVRPFSSLSPAERFPIFVTGAISFIGWVTAFVCGLLIS